VAFSGCKDEACGLVNLHDMGVIAVKKIVDGVEKRGFELYVGGGLGTVPHQAKLFTDFLPEEELPPTSRCLRSRPEKNRTVRAFITMRSLRRRICSQLEERATLRLTALDCPLSEIHEWMKSRFAPRSR
jgi:sulfite reductase (ferredoxin)